MDRTKHGGVSLGYWIADDPGTLVPLPEEAWAEARCGSWSNAPDAWWIVVPPWVEEGESDLSRG
ncbi:MAG TPA: hypothetical protein VK507_17540 [Iamia sp.]|nr:hypothetical protein [Iamia sp.]